MAVALAGAGASAEVHAAAAATLGWELVAVASRSMARAEARATAWGTRAVAYDDLPAGAGVVVVCTPPSHHLPIARQVLAAGAAVVVEPLLAATLDEADALVQVAEAAPGRVGYGEALAYAPGVLAFLRRLPALGVIGHLAARVTPPAPAERPLAEPGAHVLAVLLLAARPARPLGVRARPGGDGGVAVELELDDGRLASLAIGVGGASLPLWDLEVAGASGVLRLELAPAPLLEHDGAPLALPAPRTPEPRLDEYGYAGMLAALGDDVRAGRRPFMDAAFGRDVLAVVLAAEASMAADGATVAVPLRPAR